MKFLFNLRSQKFYRRLLKFKGKMIEKVISYLIKMGSPAGPVLIKALEVDDYHVRISIVRALGKINTKSALEGILSTLFDDEYHVQRATAKTLDEISWNPTSDKYGATYYFY